MTPVSRGYSRSHHYFWCINVYTHVRTFRVQLFFFQLEVPLPRRDLSLLEILCVFRVHEVTTLVSLRCRCGILHAWFNLLLCPNFGSTSCYAQGTYAHTYIQRHTHTYKDTHIHTTTTHRQKGGGSELFPQLDVCLYTTYIPTHIHTYMQTHTHVHTHIHVYKYIHTRVYIDTDTYTHEPMDGNVCASSHQIIKWSSQQIIKWWSHQIIK